MYGLTLNARLVTLSACESGVNKNLPGDELMGLTRAFMYAGAASLVVSLWRVDDLSTGLLMEDFYRRLLDSGDEPAQALRAAQLRVRDLTLAEAAEQVEARAEADRLELARLAVLAGDLDAAIAYYEGLLTTRPSGKMERRLRLLRLKAEEPVAVDYGRRPFADPYHWAAFVLVGDWRAR